MIGDHVWVPVTSMDDIAAGDLVYYERSGKEDIRVGIISRITGGMIWANWQNSYEFVPDKKTMGQYGTFCIVYPNQSLFSGLHKAVIKKIYDPSQQPYDEGDI